MIIKPNKYKTSKLKTPIPWIYGAIDTAMLDKLELNQHSVLIKILEPNHFVSVHCLIVSEPFKRWDCQFGWTDWDDKEAENETD